MLNPPRILERDLPAMARPSFRTEWSYYLLLGCAVGAIEGNLVALIAKKTFGAPDWLTGLIWGIPISANLLNLGWGVLLRGRRIVPAMMALTLALGLLVASIGLSDPAYGSWVAVLFAIQVACVHLMMSGLLTLRVAVWRANYPAEVRARITSRLQTLRMLMLAVATTVIAWVFDHDPGAYRYLYPGLGLLSLLALLPAARLRIRREGSELRALAALREGEPSGGLLAGVRESLGILRRDRTFARYMGAQFMMGSANFLTDPVLLTILIGTLQFSYSGTTRLMFVLPTVVILVSIHMWAGYFDRVGVVRFRVLNSALWIASYLCTFVAVLLIGDGANPWVAAVLGLLIVARLINGFCKGGGNLAWSLGHLHFASPHQASLYMGVHVALTGLRGLIMPLLGVWLYGRLGTPYFALPLGLSLAAFTVFRSLDRAERQAAVAAT